MKILYQVLFIALILTLSSCLGPSMIDRNGNPCNPVPNWVKTLPKSKHIIYAVGFAMPDTFPERSLKAAKMTARLELAKTIETKISVDSQIVDSYMKKLGIKNTEKARTTVMRNIIKEKATKMIRNSKIEKIFYDNCNLNGRGEGAHYVLASVPR